MNYPKGHEFEFKSLYPSQIKFDPLYQRELDTRRVDKIVKEWNGDLFNEPKVSWRDGAYWCFNGQHTIAAWKKLHNKEDKLIYCKVFRGMTWSDECDAFIQQNGISKDPTTNQKLKAQFNNSDPDVVDMVKKAALCGYTVDFSTNKTPTRIVATSALFRAYKALSPEAFLDMLTVIKEAWYGDEDAVNICIITGMAAFFKTYYGNFKLSELVKNLKKISPAQIIRNGKNYNSRSGYAAEILKIYNSKRKVRLDAEKL